MAKTHDLVVAIGKYQDREGKEKTRYENIGSVITKDDGGTFLLLKRTFNPAGVPNPENKDMIVVSMFSSDDKREQPQQQSRRPAQQSQQSQGGGFDDFEDDIPL